VARHDRLGRGGADVVSSEERRVGQLIGRQTTAVAFADLVGFTELGESVGHEELGDQGLDWSFAEEKKLKGFSSDVKAYRARRARSAS